MASESHFGGAWRLFWPLGSLWDGVLASWSPLGGSGRSDLGSGTLDLGSGRSDLGSETILGPFSEGFLRVFLWDGDQI